MKRDADTPAKVKPSSDHVDEGAGLALRLAREKGLVVTDIDDLSYQELKDYAFDELIEEGRFHA